MLGCHSRLPIKANAKIPKDKTDGSVYVWQIDEGVVKKMHGRKKAF